MSNIDNIENTYYNNQYLLTVRVMSGISLACCLLVVISFCSFSSLRKASGHYSLWVALANILHCVCVIFDGASGTILCSVTGFVRVYANLAMFVVNILMANRMVALMTPQQQQQSLRHRSQSQARSQSSSVFSYGGQLKVSLYEFLLVWAAPLTLTSVPFLIGHGVGYGKPEGGRYCWLNSAGWDKENRYLFLYYYIPLWVTMVYITAIYAYIFFEGKAKIAHFVALCERINRNNDGRTNSGLDGCTVGLRIQKLINTLRWYPFNLLFVNVVRTVITIMVFYQRPPITLLIIQLYTDNILGMLDSIAYFSLPVVQAAWGKWMHHVRRGKIKNKVMRMLCRATMGYCCCYWFQVKGRNGIRGANTDGDNDTENTGSEFTIFDESSNMSGAVVTTDTGTTQTTDTGAGTGSKLSSSFSGRSEASSSLFSRVSIASSVVTADTATTGNDSDDIFERQLNSTRRTTNTLTPRRFSQSQFHVFVGHLTEDIFDDDNDDETYFDDDISSGSGSGSGSGGNNIIIRETELGGGHSHSHSHIGVEHKTGTPGTAGTTGTEVQQEISSDHHHINVINSTTTTTTSNPLQFV